MQNFQIIPVPILPWGMMNAYLIVTKKGLILFDSGVPHSEKKIERCLKQHGYHFRDIQLIIISHAHADHAGSAKNIQELSQAPILAHEADLPYFLQEKPMHYCPSGWFGRLFLKTGVPEKNYAKFQPEILLKEKEHFELDDFGLKGNVLSTPGHTSGSISLCLGHSALVGDLVSSGIFIGGIMFKNKAKAPPFEEQPRLVAQELLSLVDQGVKTFYLGHGGPLTTDVIKNYSQNILNQKINKGHVYEKV